MINSLIHWCLHNRLVVALLALMLGVGGILVAPFDWEIPGVQRYPIGVDAIPDIGENQQIVFTEWAGRSPQDIEDQVTYPLTTALLGLPSVKAIRSNSMFGFSTIFIIFDDSVDFYWSRSRILEKLNSLTPGTLPDAVQPTLGPDATGLGQVFWYTLEGRDSDGNPVGGWDPQELRSIQDWLVRFALQSVDGVSEVASIGGFIKEYQIDVNPDAMRAYDVQLDDIFRAVRESNDEVGARTIEVNRVEYVIRGLGWIKDLDDLRTTVVKARDGSPITLDQVAEIELGPALRRGVLDKDGVEAVGGVVTARYGENPLAVIENVHEKIAQIAGGLPSKTLTDGTVSQVTIVPFYDRTGLILETLGTLEDALSLEVLCTVLVIILLVWRLRSALIISSVLPLAVLVTFLAMKLTGIEANIVALAGIAIAIGTVVDMGIVLCGNIQEKLDQAPPSEPRTQIVWRASTEVGGAVLTAVMTTVIGFLPVFFMTGAEGKLFRPLAFTKTYALIASVIVSLTLVPVLALILLRASKKDPTEKQAPRKFFARTLPWPTLLINGAVALAVALFLASAWQPLGPTHTLGNTLFVFIVVGSVLLFFRTLVFFYVSILRMLLRFKILFLSGVLFVILFGGVSWLGGPGPLRNAFPGLQKEFMPALDEGSFLFMPKTMPHASIGEAAEMLSMQDRAIQAIPEVESVVGKIGRVDSPMDPAPVSMVETIINYKPEFAHNEDGELVRQWRDEIKTPDDIWNEIATVTQMPGATIAPKLQPIETRLVMLQTGMRAPMGVKVYATTLEELEQASLTLEKQLQSVPGVRSETVFADRVVGKPYLEITPDRQELSRYGLTVKDLNDMIEVAIGGKPVTTTVEGRERYPVRVRYPRELRGDIESLENILIATNDGAQIPLQQVASINYVRGPQSIKSENSFLTAYVIFDHQPGMAEVDVAQTAEKIIRAQQATGEFTLPHGVTYEFTGTYENQIHAMQRLRLVLPVALLLIFLLIYMQFKKIGMSFLVFSGVFVAWSGGFILIWLYNQPWFLDVSLFGWDLRQIFQVQPISLSVAVWVGFLALFGIATDDGVLMGTYLQERFKDTPKTKAAVREAVLEAANRRIGPACMTSATTILALLPVLTSSGRGSDVMIPMAIPTVGGMLVALITVFVVPVVYSAMNERGKA
ncbi:efflux RND transporter permease subunit [Cerasicoccus arenae]|uniref:Cation transporter n=1 Tax=Cerasicoccus arenae TaxID=424488 RepID=A0A8J3GD93_9BACT|nr:efflux RND transporter permease subunit [Cerasicoccus arenae]MBK1856947.1 efflux RND transporter permease subunit [Cerasicoccus arenae]GHB89986.1 cation transporter [Cerasicoccus arenae]